MRAEIAAASMLLLSNLGCRQVGTLEPNSAAISVNSTASEPGKVPAESATRTIETRRIPLDEADSFRIGILDELPAGVSWASYELPESGAADHSPLSGPEAPKPSNFDDVSKGLGELSRNQGMMAEDRPAAEGRTVPYSFQTHFGQILAETREDVLHDYSNYYRLNTLGQFALILAQAAVFANSDYDADVGNWYQTHIRSKATNDASNFLRPLGNGYYTIPFYVSAKFLGECLEDEPGMSLLGQFGDRTTRALLVGGPPFLALQYLTGGGRPSIYADESYWRPFRGSHGASGHAFMGAVPFLTMAGMTDDPLAKCFFYACSPWTGFTRINDNVHYMSQVWLGWWMAFLATESVYDSEKQKGPVTITPLCTPEMTGVGLIYEH